MTGTGEDGCKGRDHRVDEPAGARLRFQRSDRYVEVLTVERS
jgi:hypothetical protein